MSYLKIGNNEIECLFFHTNFAEVLLDLRYVTKMPIKLEYNDGFYISDYINIIELHEQALELSNELSRNEIYFDYEERKFIIFIEKQKLDRHRYIPIARIEIEDFNTLKDYKKEISYRYYNVKKRQISNQINGSI